MSQGQFTIFTNSIVTYTESSELFSPNVTRYDLKSEENKSFRNIYFIIGIGLLLVLVLCTVYIEQLVISIMYCGTKVSKDTHMSHSSAVETFRSISEVNHNKMDADIQPMSVSISEISYLNKVKLNSLNKSNFSFDPKININKGKNDVVILMSASDNTLSNGKLVTVAEILHSPENMYEK